MVTHFTKISIRVNLTATIGAYRHVEGLTARGTELCLRLVDSSTFWTFYTICVVGMHLHLLLCLRHFSLHLPLWGHAHLPCIKYSVFCHFGLSLV